MAKRGLGRGIDALMGGVADESPGGIQEVVLDMIQANPDQPRKHFDEGSLQELAESIREKGVIQPLLVEQLLDGSYQIIAGERRFRASRMAGVASVPVIVRDFTPGEKMEIALIENIQREDLSPVEEARAYRELMESSGLNQEALAKRLGKNRSTIANAVRLLKLPAEVQQALEAGQLSAGHARAVLQAGNQAAMQELFQCVQRDGLSVRQAEQLARGGSQLAGRERTHSNQTTEQARKTIALMDLEEKLIVALGTKVVINGSEEKGRIEIGYYSLEDLNRIVDLLPSNKP